MDVLNYPLQYRRLNTRQVKIGLLSIGAGSPVLIQSMLTTATDKVQECIEEISALVDVGCELIRLTIPTRKSLDAVFKIKKKMKQEGLVVPLVADVHFSPKLAVDACELFEKVRINPGNFSDSSRSEKYLTDGAGFDEGHQKMREAVQPLIKNLKKYQRALRIGVNHGSLSHRMMERYGDSPQGMIQSALEMIDLFEDQGYRDLVVSLKSSNPVVVQKAYRLLIENSPEKDMVALHLGVTEAGNGSMGRIKSLVGIGALLSDGIGDTIRVSLTEPSINEIHFAKSLLKHLTFSEKPIEFSPKFWERPLNHQRIENLSRKMLNTVIGSGTSIKIGVEKRAVLPETDISFNTDFSYFFKGKGLFLENLSKPVFRINGENLIDVGASEDAYSAILVDTANPLETLREYYQNRSEDKKSIPVGVMYPSDESQNNLKYETHLAAILSEGLADFLLIPPKISSDYLVRMLYLLQATRAKIVVTDYIACPSCGRTLFDLIDTTEKIKNRTRHLKGLKIGIMGCIVNGPGEMADADFGYVGSGPGKIDLYYGQERVCRGIDEKNAVGALIDLIKEKGCWIAE